MTEEVTQEPESTVVRFGNGAVRRAYRDENDQMQFEDLPGLVNRISTFVAHPSKSVGTVFAEITSPTGFWVHHSGQAPAWVESNKPGLALMLSEHYGCPVGVPEGEEWQ